MNEQMRHQEAMKKTKVHATNKALAPSLQALFIEVLPLVLLAALRRSSFPLSLPAR